MECIVCEKEAEVGSKFFAITGGYIEEGGFLDKEKFVADSEEYHYIFCSECELRLGHLIQNKVFK